MKIVTYLKFGSLKFVGIFVGTVIGAVMTTTAIAAVPDANGIIHGCYSITKGDMRILDPASSNCKNSETNLNWRQNSPLKENLVGADLSSTSMKSWDLRGLNLSGANLTAAQLNGADLRNSIFLNTNLAGADLTDANLNGIDLTSANLEGSNFDNTILVGSKLNGTNLNGTRFLNSNLANFQFTNNLMINVLFTKDNLAGANFQSLKSIDQTTNFIMDSVDLTNSVFSGDTLNQITISGNSKLTGTKFINSHFVFSHIANINFSNSDFQNAVFDNTDLRSADLRNANLSGTVWISSSCPDSTSSIDNNDTCIGHLTPVAF